MDLKSDLELESTKQKLRWLEECYEQESREASVDPHVRAMSLRSLRRTMNQFQEEIIRYEAKRAANVRQKVLS